ncbi:TPR-like protein [Xylaria sp. FL0043]|nr:TPR-like protein [Xylaria sp. FL0043]
MTTKSRQDAFSVTFSLLRNAFPNRRGETHLYKCWAVCEQFHQHVQALSKMHTLLKGSGVVLNTSGYQTLIRDDIWFMLESQQFIGAEAFIKSRSVRVLECAKVEFDIFVAHHGPEENDLANAYSDMGYASCSAFDPQKALMYLDRAVDIALSHQKSKGRAKAQLRDFDGSLNDVTKAEYYQAKIHGEGSHYDGEINHERAKIAAAQGKLEEAIALNQRALELVRRGKPTHSSVIASHYQQGRVFYLMGKHDEALQELEKAHTICQLNESTRGNSGSLLHYKKMDEAKAFFDTARKIGNDLLATVDYASVKDDEDSWDNFVGLLYR